MRRKRRKDWRKKSRRAQKTRRELRKLVDSSLCSRLLFNTRLRWGRSRIPTQTEWHGQVSAQDLCWEEDEEIEKDSAASLIDDSYHQQSLFQSSIIGVFSIARLWGYSGSNSLSGQWMVVCALKRLLLKRPLQVITFEIGCNKHNRILRGVSTDYQGYQNVANVCSSLRSVARD